MTRGMFVAVMERTAKLLGVYQAPANPVPFDDVKETDYFASASTWAEVGLVTGVGDNQLAPNAPISRQQMCAMMARFLEKCVGMDLTSDQQQESSFLDQNTISSYAVGPLRAAWLWASFRDIPCPAAWSSVLTAPLPVRLWPWCWSGW